MGNSDKKNGESPGGVTFLDSGNEKALEDLLELAYGAGENYGKNKGVKVHIDAIVLNEALIFSRESLSYHSNVQDPNHYKQIGHLVYWLKTLKPFRVSLNSEEERRRLIQPFLAAILALISKKEDKATLKQVMSEFENDFCTVTKQYNDSLCSVNEELAVAIAIQLFAVHEKRAWENLGAEFNEEKFKIKMSQCREMLVRSFRKHNYSARGLSTAFEWALGAKTRALGSSPH